MKERLGGFRITVVVRLAILLLVLQVDPSMVLRARIRLPAFPSRPLRVCIRSSVSCELSFMHYFAILSHRLCVAATYSFIDHDSHTLIVHASHSFILHVTLSHFSFMRYIPLLFIRRTHTHRSCVAASHVAHTHSSCLALIHRHNHLPFMRRTHSLFMRRTYSPFVYPETSLVLQLRVLRSHHV